MSELVRFDMPRVERVVQGVGSVATVGEEMERCGSSARCS